MGNNTPSYNFITEDLDNELEDLNNELEDLEKVYNDYQENEKEYIKFIKEKTQNQLRNRRRSFQSPLPHPNLNYSSPTPPSEIELPIITNIPKHNIKQLFSKQNTNIIIENGNIKSIYLTKLSFFGIVLGVNLMYYLIYYDYLNLKRITYN